LFFLGLDFGTSGARACVIDAAGRVVAEDSRDFGQLEEYERAGIWREALWDLVASLPAPIRTQLDAIAIDGTSGTVLACDEALDPRHPPLLYNDDRAAEEAQLIARTANADHPAAAVTSGLAKILWLKKRLGLTGARLYLNQADWLSGMLTGRVGLSDYHNALKTGLDLDTLRWPEWVEYLADVDYLPVPVAPGSAVATVSRPRARYLGINPRCMVRAGTTDSIAAFLAAGVRQNGEAVTSLGSTLVLKLLSDTRVESGEHGVYSPLVRRSLAGGRRLQRRRRSAAAVLRRPPAGRAEHPDRSQRRQPAGLPAAAFARRTLSAQRPGAGAETRATPGRRCRVPARPAGKPGAHRGARLCPAGRTRSLPIDSRRDRRRRGEEPGMDRDPPAPARRAGRARGAYRSGIWLGPAGARWAGAVR
jgi:sugar (pentulose or hexulose) kinase